MLPLVASIFFLGLAASVFGLFLTGVLWDSNTAILRFETTLAGLLTVFALVNFTWEVKARK